MTTRRSAIGRADLVRAIGARDGEGLAAVAELLGYRRQQTDSKAEANLSPTPFSSTLSVDSTPEPLFSPPPQLNFAPIPFLRVVKVEYFEDEATVESTPLQKIDLDPDPRSGPPSAAPLVPWPRLWRILEDVFRAKKRSARLDVKALVQSLARGRVIRRLPRQRVPSVGYVTLLLDRSGRLVPFWQDQIALALALRQKLGPDALKIGIVPKRGPEGIAAAPGLLLVVGDLGLLGEPVLAKAWEAAGVRLAREGAQLSALLPCPRNRWLSPLTKLWRAIEWENPALEAKPEPLAQEEELISRRDRVLRLLLPAIRIEPGLLRGVRQLLGPDADAGTEVDAWKEFPNPSVVAAAPPEDFATRLEKIELAEALRRHAFELIQHWHGDLPPLILAEETFSTHGRAVAVSSERLAAREVLRAGMAEVLERGMAGAAFPAQWFQGFSKRCPGEVADQGLAREVIATWRVLYSQAPSLPLPSWASPALLAALAPTGELRHLEIWQNGNEIALKPEGFGGRSPLGEIKLSSGHLEVQIFSGVGPGLGPTLSKSFCCDLEAGTTTFELEELPQALRFVSNLESVELEGHVRPSWASAAGRDKYGFWADLEVEGVTQRMRYIRPGRFLMGSPETEKGRRDNEGPRHLVTLTDSFWLAATPCTQEFWQVVMGNNPSWYKGPRGPVERVSWADVQEFLQRLNERAVFLGARLPTEAQWEYACRAGTTTSTYAGELEILGLRRGTFLDEIAWHEGNSFDSLALPEKQDPHQNERARDVASKRCNAWGLYDTLGNVWEWCSDYWGSYGVGECKDPEGPEVGSTRVARGGPVKIEAGLVRAAYRRSFGPVARPSSLGFRFSLGQ